MRVQFFLSGTFAIFFDLQQEADQIFFSTLVAIIDDFPEVSGEAHNSCLRRLGFVKRTVWVADVFSERICPGSQSVHHVSSDVHHCGDDIDWQLVREVCYQIHFGSSTEGVQQVIDGLANWRTQSLKYLGRKSLFQKLAQVGVLRNVVDLGLIPEGL